MNKQTNKQKKNHLFCEGKSYTHGDIHADTHMFFHPLNQVPPNSSSFFVLEFKNAKRQELNQT